MSTSTTISEADRQKMKEIADRINNIDAKSNCGTVRFLDKVADLMVRFANWQIALSEKVRKLTAKVNAPCSITFSKK